MNANIRGAMDTKNKGKINHICASAHLRLHPHGFTLVEMLVTLSIIVLMGMVAGTTYYKNYQAEIAYRSTLDIMDTIKKAILGSNIPHNRGVHISGYVADMGGLPSLNNDSQPESLWKKADGIEKSVYHEEARIRTGWNGPYISYPETGFLTDGWGMVLIFQKDSPGRGDMTIISYGEDGRERGSYLDKDIKMVIKKEHYMVPIGFCFKGTSTHSSEFEINYPDPENGSLKKSEKIELSADSSFISNAGQLFPVGLRSVTACITRGDGKKEKVIVFTVHSGMNYLGEIE